MSENKLGKFNQQLKKKKQMIYLQHYNLIKKEIKLLKGKIIIIRTSIEECYKRVVNRWKEKNKNYNEEELIRYQNRKLGMFEWYKSLNKFLENVRLVTLKFKDFCKEGTEKQFDENKHLNEQTRFIYGKLKKLL